VAKKFKKHLFQVLELSKLM